MSLDEMVKRYVVTTAQKGATINKGFYDNLKNYCQVNKAELLILPTSGKSILDEEVGLHPDLQQHSIITTEYKLNNSIRISNYALKPQQILPLTGLKRFAQGDKSFIFASTKQQLQYVANSYDLIPKAIMTTGSITNPRYNENNRIGRIATKNSARGGGLGAQMVVESIKYCHSKQSSLSIEMSAQVYLTDFYKNLGFTPQGGMYLEDGIPHIKMSYQNNL